MAAASNTLTPQPFFCDKHFAHNHASKGRSFSVGLLTREYRGCVPCTSFCLPGTYPVTDFRRKKNPHHIQRRYRSGFTPDYLVQHPSLLTPGMPQKSFSIVKRIITPFVPSVNSSRVCRSTENGTARTKTERSAEKRPCPRSGKYRPAGGRRRCRFPSAPGSADIHSYWAPWIRPV